MKDNEMLIQSTLWHNGYIYGYWHSILIYNNFSIICIGYNETFVNKFPPDQRPYSEYITNTIFT